MMIAGGSDGISKNLGEVYNILHLSSVLPIFGVNVMKYKIYNLHSICIHLLHKVWSFFKFCVSEQISWFHEAAEFLSSKSLPKKP